MSAPSWPLSTLTHPELTPINLAKAGYFYHPDTSSSSHSNSNPDASTSSNTVDDQCRCFLCGKTLGGWDETDDPFVEHWRRGAASIASASASASAGAGGRPHGKKEPDACGWAMAVCSVVLDKRRRKVEWKGKGKMPNDWLYPIPILLPTSEEMTAARLATFGKANTWWPHPLGKKSGWLTTPLSLSKAGFVYTPTTETPDGATCFYCETSLDGWECVDEPWAQHEKRAPDCPFFLARLEGGEEEQAADQAVVLSKSVVKRATKALKSAISRKTVAASRSRNTGGTAQTQDHTEPSASESDADDENAAKTDGEAAEAQLDESLTAAAHIRAKTTPRTVQDLQEEPELQPLVIVSPTKKQTRARKTVAGSAPASSKSGKAKSRTTAASKSSYVTPSETDGEEEVAEAVLGESEGDAGQETRHAESSREVEAIQVAAEEPTPKQPVRAGRKTAATTTKTELIAPAVAAKVAATPESNSSPIPAPAKILGLGRPPAQRAPARVTRKASAALSASTSTVTSTVEVDHLHTRTTSTASSASTSSSVNTGNGRRAGTRNGGKSKQEVPPAAVVTPDRVEASGSSVDRTLEVVVPPQGLIGRNKAKASIASEASAKPARATIMRKATSTATVAPPTVQAETTVTKRKLDPGLSKKKDERKKLDRVVTSEQEEETRQIRDNSRRLGAKEARDVMENLHLLTPRAKKAVDAVPLEENITSVNTPSHSDLAASRSAVGSGLGADMENMSVLEYIRSVYQQRFAELKEDGERMVENWEERVMLERRRIEGIPSSPRG